MNVCFIGNSHLGKMFYKLTENREEYSDINPTFFIERAVGTIPLVIQGTQQYDRYEVEDVLLTRTRPVFCSIYDAFVVCGMDFGLTTLLRLWRDYRPAHAADEASVKHVVSLDFFERAAQSILEESKALRICQQLANRSSRPVILMPSPLPMEWATSGSTLHTSFFPDLHYSGQSKLLRTLYASALADARQRGVIVLEQPAPTVADNFFTRTEFSLADPDNKSGDSLYSKGDFHHANEEFADLSLDDLRQALRETNVAD